jgi:Peptidoglycan-synthase activator LpoB
VSGVGESSVGFRISIFVAWVVAAALAGGCSSAISSGHNTALDSMDLNVMTSQMAAQIMGSPAVQAEIAHNGPLKVVCEPVENRMTGEVLPQGDAEAYTAQVRALLSEKAPNDFTWIMNRDEFYDLRSKELTNVPLGPSPDAVNPQYALAARFDSLTQEDSEHRSSYYLCVYRLTDIDQRTVLWTGEYKVKKNAVKGFLD